jgi:hypothetical protein
LAVTASLTSLPLFLFALPRRWSNKPALRRRSHRTSARGVGRGRTAQPARTPRAGACAGSDSTAGGSKRPYYPFHRASEANPSTPASATCPALRTAKGMEGFSSSSCSRLRIKRTRPAWHGRQATHPLLGFSLPPPPRLHRIGGRSGRAATETRRAREAPEAEPEQERLHRQGRRRSWEGEKVVRVGGRNRTGAGNRTPPGTPTTPRHRRSRSGFDYTAAPK